MIILRLYLVNGVIWLHYNCKSQQEKDYRTDLEFNGFVILDYVHLKSDTDFII